MPESLKEILRSAAGVSLGLALGNFAYQALGRQDWDTAAERSFFQLFAIAVFVVVHAIRQRRNRSSATE